VIKEKKESFAETKNLVEIKKNECLVGLAVVRFWSHIINLFMTIFCATMVMHNSSSKQ
jgi:hypothetical protein